MLQTTPVARTAQQRDDALFELANAQEGVSKAMRHISRLANDVHALVPDIWRNLERLQRYITDAQSDVRVEAFTSVDAEDAAA